MAYAKIAVGIVSEWEMNAQGLKLAESEKEDLAIMIQKALVKAAEATREKIADWYRDLPDAQKDSLAGIDIRALPLPGDE